jgi:hypothetical protein
MIMNEVVINVEGELRINLPPDDPSTHFLEKVGFERRSIEMRFKKDARKWTQSKTVTNEIEASGTAAPGPTRNRS